MTAPEFRAALARLDLRQIEAAAVLARSHHTVSRYALGKLPVPEQDARLLLACELWPPLVTELMTRD